MVIIPTVQVEVLQLLHECCNEFGASVMLITHNMSVVADWADRETGEVSESLSAVAASFTVNRSTDAEHGLMEAEPGDTKEPRFKGRPIAVCSRDMEVRHEGTRFPSHPFTNRLRFPRSRRQLQPVAHHW
ncbi:hypothetical protein [Boudabousia marimammalium]|uniref:hypothetical protein n=1 Tax=Boudabousia marimammalium TaxID=156892 RepID=UPI001FE46C61|nr:hypothetical protein [Boudabousia marimammalium]